MVAVCVGFYVRSHRFESWCQQLLVLFFPFAFGPEVEKYDENLHEKTMEQGGTPTRYYFENLKISIPQIKLSVFTSNKLPLDLKVSQCWCTLRGVCVDWSLSLSGISIPGTRFVPFLYRCSLTGVRIILPDVCIYCCWKWRHYWKDEAGWSNTHLPFVKL